MKTETSYFQVGFKGFVNGNSYLYKLDARIKIISSIIIMSASIFMNGLISLAILLVFVLMLVVFSDVKCSYIFSPIPPLIPFLLIAVLFRLFTHTQEDNASLNVIWRWKIFIISAGSLNASILLLFRFLVIFTLISTFSATTRLEDFTKGIERIVRPLQKIGLPAHEFSMVISIAVNFFHVLVNDMNRIIKAQASRGADFELKKFNLIKKVRRLFPLMIPLFILSFEHSKHLIEALESRCYRGGRGRSYYIVSKYSKLDYIFLAISITATGLSFFIMRAMNFDKMFGRISTFL